MPRISELPTNAELTGNETIAIVQDGETRQVPLSEALIARHPVSLNHIRWINSNDSTDLINSPSLELNLANSGGC